MTPAADELEPAAPTGGPPGSEASVDGLVPFVHVADLERSIAFYLLLGFEVRRTYEHGGRRVWAWLHRASAQLMLAAASGPVDAGQQAVLFYLYTSNLRARREHLLAHGAHPGAIHDGTPAPRQQLRIADPDGYCLMIAQREGVDEPAAV
jgi:hypothetical protein